VTRASVPRTDLMAHGFRLRVPRPTALRGLRTRLTYEDPAKAVGLPLRNGSLVEESRTPTAAPPRKWHRIRAWRSQPLRSSRSEPPENSRASPALAVSREIPSRRQLARFPQLEIRPERSSGCREWVDRFSDPATGFAPKRGLTPYRIRVTASCHGSGVCPLFWAPGKGENTHG